VLLRSEDRTACCLTWAQVAPLVRIGWGVALLWTKGRSADSSAASRAS